jgi:hypothetical protein
LINGNYFSKTENLINEIMIDGSLKVVGIVTSKNLTFDEKFNYLKSQILKEPNIKIEPLKNFLQAMKGYVIFSELEVLYTNGFVEAKKLYDVLADDEDIEKERKRLMNK